MNENIVPATEARPCPLCGGAAAFQKHSQDLSGFALPDWSLGCPSCALWLPKEQGERWIPGEGTKSTEAEAKTKLLALWNKRTDVFQRLYEKVRDENIKLTKQPNFEEPAQKAVPLLWSCWSTERQAAFIEKESLLAENNDSCSACEIYRKAWLEQMDAVEKLEQERNEATSELNEIYGLVADKLHWCRSFPVKYSPGQALRAVEVELRESQGKR